MERRIEAIRKRLNQELQEFHRDGEYHRGVAEFVEGAHRLLMSGEAKRIRGVIPSLVAEDLRLPAADCITYGVIVELLHFTSLVHDDVIDQHQTRRGIRTLNHRFSDTTAVLTGDYLIYEVIERCLTLAHGLRIIGEVVATAREMVAGVVMEQTALPRDPTLANYLAMARAKTGSLFGLSFSLPFIADPRLPQVRECGALFGVLFQIHDDRLDLSEDRTHENIYHLLPPAEVDRVLAEHEAKLRDLGGRVGIEPTLRDVIGYLQGFGYFR